MPTIGVLYPGHSAEDDYPWLEQHLLETGVGDPSTPIRLPLVHTSVGEDAHRVDALLDLGSHERLATGVRSLQEQHDLDAVMWACTSGSFVFGWDGAREQVDRLSQVAGRPVSSTSLAFAAACRALGLDRVSVAASYPQDVAEHFVRFLAADGIAVTSMGSHGIVTAREVGTLGYDDVAAMAAGADLSAGSQALLIPDTAMHTLAWVDRLEELLGVPVLTANQVTVWQGLRLSGGVPHCATLGSLFRTAHGD